MLVAPPILNCGTMWRSVSFRSRHLYPQRESPVLLNRRLVRFERRSGLFEEETNLLRLRGIRPLFVGRPVLSLIAVPNELSRNTELFCNILE